MTPSLFGLWLAGVLTFASPCVLPLIPAYLAAMGAGRQTRGRSRVVASAALFALGISVVFVALGAGAVALSSRLMAHRTALLLASGALMLLFGLRNLRMLPVTILDRDFRPALTRVGIGGSIAAPFLFGVAFALGWSPCVGPMLASALTFAAAHAATPWDGAALLSVYASGFAVPLVGVAFLAEGATAWLRSKRSLAPRLERLAGVLLVCVGIWTLVGAASKAPELARTPATESPCAASSEALGCALPSEASENGPKNDISGPRFVEFVSADCPVCRKMLPAIARTQAACDGLADRTVRIDVGTKNGLATARALGVVATPTFVFVREDNVESARLIGEQPESELYLAVEATFGRCTSRRTGESSPG